MKDYIMQKQQVVIKLFMKLNSRYSKRVVYVQFRKCSEIIGQHYYYDTIYLVDNWKVNLNQMTANIDTATLLILNR
jgi:hypothetical protein